jgi:hypothetical protein
LVVMLAACRLNDDPAPVTPVETAIDTIGGVEYLRNTGTPPTWRIETRLTLGSAGAIGEPAPDEFGRVSSAITGPNNRVYVADALNDEIKVFDPNGALAFRFGRDGEGPGEFGTIYSLAWLGDTLLALDFQVGRIGLFSADGEWIGQRRHPGSISGSPAFLRFFQTDQREAWAFSLSTSPDRSRVFVRHTPNGVSDTLRLLSADDPTSSVIICDHPNGSISFFNIPYASRLLQHPARNGLLAAVQTAEYRIAFLDATGDTVRVVERELEPVPTTSDGWDEGLEEYRTYRDENPGASCEPGSVDRPSVQPPVRSLLLDPGGRLWTEVITVDGVFWEVFDPRGRLAGRVPAFSYGDRTAPYFSDRYVVAVHTDTLDTPSVTVYEVHTQPR